MSLERLLAARDALKEDLGLASPPPIVVTSAPKKLLPTARAMGLDPDKVSCERVLAADMEAVLPVGRQRRAARREERDSHQQVDTSPTTARASP
eukprot:763379-Hanusia_phi.AAC.2